MVDCYGRVNVQGNAKCQPGLMYCISVALYNYLLVQLVSTAFKSQNYKYLKLISGVPFWMLCWGSSIHTAL